LAEIESLTPVGRSAEATFFGEPGRVDVTGHTLAVDGGFLAQ
jgi:hypothetical protein